ncbi:hypothetical protein SCLCIDRAFT_32375 [Scleroderma citrinum Foug A]|uniref:Uncharacterized protein n=1 Tax=Scleroderma citrinum Foug A TaxID=1036808 RepID=A0A0C3D9L1_9AGAM|nr:hypothetical protein SCLCIDRAFT_32375 [Scleroderma citrinum Foug A]
MHRKNSSKSFKVRWAHSGTATSPPLSSTPTSFDNMNDIQDNSVAVPALSPSVSSSENSIQPSSPGEDDFQIKSVPFNAKFPSDDSSKKPTVVTPASSRHLRPQLRTRTRSVSVRDHTVEAQRRIDGATPLELCFVARTLGQSSHNGMTMQDVVEGRELFVKALSTMPNRVLFKAYQSKQADRDCVAHHVALTLAEIKSTEQRKDYLSAIYGQHEGKLSVTKAQLDILKELLDGHGLSDIEDDGGYHRAVYADELVALTIAEGQTNQMKGVVDSRASWTQHVGDHDESSDDDSKLPFTGLLSSDDDPDF